MSIFDQTRWSSADSKPDDIPRRLLKPLGRLLATGDPAATIDRLFESEHVKDLRLITAFALVAVLAVFVFGLPGSVLYAREFSDKYSGRVVFTALRAFVTFCTPVLAIFGAILAWAYQTGSARLGIVDLFACEIDTLCRVALVVNGVPRSIETFQHNSAPTNRHFSSEENYFPVFANNTRDLQSLEARVVVNITAFYTYMKAVRDSTRAMMDLAAASTPTQMEAQPNKASALPPWQEAARNMIYMMFLGFESARKATECLVEFEPEQVERRIVVLISELEAYCFLHKQFAETDIRHQRLELREADYKRIVPSLWHDVEAGWGEKPSEWEPARRLVPELKRKYDAVISRSPRPSRLAATA